MQTITLRDVIDASRRALRDGTLAALRYENEVEASCQYVYLDDTGAPTTMHCAIGAAMSKECINAVADMMVRDIYVDGFVINDVGPGSNVFKQNAPGTPFTFYRPDEGALAAIQTLHDSWLTGDFFDFAQRSGLTVPASALDYIHSIEGQSVGRAEFEHLLDVLEASLPSPSDQASA